jgi:hypothetical protein
MNNKSFTLYYIPQLKNINCDNFPVTAGKISDVKTVAKGFTILDFKENSNHYAICGDNSNVISMGMVKKIKTKNKNIIYIGQKIYSNSQKELFEYIKREITKRIQEIQKEIVRVQGIKNEFGKFIHFLHNTEMYDEYIDQMYKEIKTIKTNSKELITNLKKA